MRSFEMSVPALPTSGLPLIFVFHGDGGDGAGTRNAFKFEEKYSDLAVFVYPNGKNKSWDLDTWDASKNDDIAFVDAIVADVKAKYCLGNVYATGFSRGGFFANHLGCHRGNVFRAIVSHGGGGPYDATGQNFNAMGNLVCPTKGMSSMIVIGTNDGLLNDSRTSRKHWRIANECQDTTTPYPVFSPCVSHNGCKKPLVWCEIGGLGHQIWNQATDATWKFFLENK
jgi:polyhydroxybutyrate depolymerase